jgi:hypothetical protein
MSSDQSWKDSAKHIEKLNVEICFLLQNDFYIGNPDSHEQLADPKYQEPLSLPAFVRATEKSAFTSEVVGNEAQLVSYYRQIVEHGVSIGKNFNELRRYFWLRLCVWSEKDDVSISFPWYDTITEIRNFIQWLVSPQEEAFWDMDQGWQVDAIQDAGFLYLREKDPDNDESYDNVKVALRDIVASAMRANARARKIVERLSQELGVDVWSKYVQDAVFGTSDWQPNKSFNRTR